MDPRERWRALQALIGEARARFETGDRAGALEAVDRALAIDPQFPAAQVLRDRILASESRPVAIDAAPPPARPDVSMPIVSTEGYARFEQRAKRRRVDRRLDAARAAIARGRVREAAAALDEVIELDPNLPEARELSAQLEALGRGSERSRTGRTLVAAAAFGATVLGASWLQDATWLGSRPSVAIAPLVTPPSPLAPLSTTVLAASISALPEPSREAIATSGEVLTVREVEHPVLVPVRNETPATAVQPVERRDVEPAPAPVPAPVPLPPASAPAVPASETTAPPAPAPAPTPAPAPAPESVTAHADTTAPAIPTAPPRPNDELLVKQTLQHYRRAYEGLDAHSARSVWPAVNESALARAFQGLQSQSLTFDACDVKLRGESADATCKGTARYVPKVGSHEPRVEPRTWSFTLKKNGDDWQIESARADR